MADDAAAPESASTALEDAYVHRDLEGAVAAKDFEFEARMLLETMEKPDLVDSETIALTAEVLELGYRKEMRETSFPDMTGGREIAAPHGPVPDLCRV